VSINGLQNRQELLNPVLLVLRNLIDQASYVENAGNYVRLVEHVGKLVAGIEQSLHLLNQKKPYTSLLQRSLAMEKQRLASEKGAGANGSNGVPKQPNEFDLVSDLMSTHLLVPLLKLLEINTSLVAIDCHNLKTMLSTSLTSLAARMETEFRLFYSASLETLNWPVSMAETVEGTFNETTLHFFRTALLLLVKLQECIRLASLSSLAVPDPSSLSATDSSSAQLEPLPKLWCMELLVKPLEVRFNFNFRGRESTNRYDRPEWHFTYVRQLLKNHHKFLEFVTSLLHSMGLVGYDAKHEILRGLIPIIKEKMVSDLTQVSLLSSKPSSASSVSKGAASMSKLGSLVLGNSGILGSSISPVVSSSNDTSDDDVAPLLGSAANVTAPSNSTARSSASSVSIELVRALIAHSINEILDFEKTLTDAYDYPRGRPSEYPRPIDILTLPNLRKVWLDLEISSVKEHLRTLLKSGDAWERQYASVPVEDDSSRVPRYSFVLFNVLSILQERYSLLGSGREEQMSEFLEAQLSILHEYLALLKRMPTESLRSLEGVEYLKQCCVMYNAAWYSRKVLEEWGTQSLFIELYMFNKGITDPDLLSGTTFDSLIQQCKALCKHNLKLMTEKTLHIFTTAYNKSYARTNFLEDFPEHSRQQQQQTPLRSEQLGEADVSPLLCDPLFLLREAFTKVEMSLNTAAFRKCWRALAASLNTFLFESIVLKKHFQRQGALQFKVDVQAIWLLWRAQTPVPESFFKDTHEAICILTLHYDKLRDLTTLINSVGRHPTPQQQAEMGQFGIFKLSPSQVRQVLDRLIEKKSNTR